MAKSSICLSIVHIDGIQFQVLDRLSIGMDVHQRVEGRGRKGRKYLIPRPGQLIRIVIESQLGLRLNLGSLLGEEFRIYGTLNICKSL